MSDLTEADFKRYQRHLSLKGFGTEGQRRLKNTKVLVVGAGGLGCPVLLYLTAAGLGELAIADDDVVSVSNLQRQVLYGDRDIGRPKVEVAASVLSRLNPNVSLQAHQIRISTPNVGQLMRDYDIVVDATDNFPTRYLLNDACVLFDKVLVHGSILRFEGHVGVFNHLLPDGTRSANYRDLFPEPPAPGSVPDCSEAGVLGVLPGIIGAMQALEVIKIATGVGGPLANKLLIWDCLDMTSNVINIRNSNARAHIKTLIDYEDFCGISQEKNKSLKPNEIAMKEVTVQELQKMKESGEDFQLIDVREPYEYDICNLGGELIPMSEIPNSVEKIATNKKVVIHCRSGKRSGDMLLWLEKNHNLNNLYNLKGGILAWARDIDPEMPTY